MELETAKNIATIAAPLTKIVLETYLLPKLKDLKSKWNKDKMIVDHYFESKFSEYISDSYEKNAILNTVAFKKRKVLLKDVFIPLTLNCSETSKEIKIDNYNDELFTDSNKILITDTAGMGKSTLSKKLLISSINENKGIPILIELRRLSKSKGIIAEILEQLNPINESLDKQFILDLIKRGDFIFIFDGFDEISLSERSSVTTEIQKFISKAKNNKFILTSRPEDALSSFGDFQKFQIKPLKPEEAFTLLEKYDNYGELSKLLISKIKEEDNYKNIEEYLTTPLLVSLLFTAFEHKQRIPFQKHIFYRQVYDALFESHDLSKGDSFERDKHTGLGSDEFHRILRIFGYLCLKSGNKIEFTRDELTNIIQNSIDYCSNLKITPSNFIKDLLITVPIFIKDGIYFKWSHKSLQEYFSAQFIYLDSKEKQSDILEHLSFHKNNISFINVIDLYKSMDPIGFEQTVTLKFLVDYINHLNKTYINFIGTEKLIRQQFTFTHDIYLIKCQFEPRTENNHPAKVFKILKDYTKEITTRMSIAMNVGIDEKLISYVKIPNIPNPYNTLLRFYYSQREDFVFINERKNNIQEIELKLKEGKAYPVSDRKNAYLNKGDNFKKTNDLIKMFLSRHRFLNIDRDRAEKRIDRINSYKSIKSNDDLLNF